MPSFSVVLNQIPNTPFVESDWNILSGSGNLSPMVHFTSSGKSLVQLDAYYVLPDEPLIERKGIAFPYEMATSPIVVPAGTKMKFRAYLARFGSVSVNLLY